MTKIIAFVTELLATLTQSTGVKTQLQPVRVERDAPKRDLLHRR